MSSSFLLGFIFRILIIALGWLGDLRYHECLSKRGDKRKLMSPHIRLLCCPDNQIDVIAVTARSVRAMAYFDAFCMHLVSCTELIIEAAMVAHSWRRGHPQMPIHRGRWICAQDQQSQMQEAIDFRFLLRHWGDVPWCGVGLVVFCI